MNHRLHIHKKAASQSASTPASNLSQSPPISVPETVTPEETANLQQQQEWKESKGINLLEIPNLVTGSSSLIEPPQSLQLQAKLTIGEPGDRYEQEADRVAADVVQRIHAPSPQIQREEIESVGDEPMQMSPLGSRWRSAVVQREEIESVGDEPMQMSPMGPHWRHSWVQRQDVLDEEQVMRKPQVSFLQPISQNSNAPSNKLIVQRVASQIIPNFTAEKGGTQKATSIRQVQIIGRPEKVFSSTMGDHTTAFAVHREAIKQQLEGKDFITAFGVIQGFYDTALTLPGWELRDGLPEPHKQRLDQAKVTLETLLKNKSNPSSPHTLSALQQTVGAYLDFRELIPLSTINVRAKSPVHAGKGKGEASKVNTLVVHQGGEPQSVEARKQAIVGLFDASSVALAIVEQDETLLGKMLPGLGGKVTLKERMGKIIKQHLLSIKQGFPGIFDQDLSVEETEGALESALKMEMEDWLIATVEDLDKKIQKREEWIEKTTANLVVTSGKKSKQKINQEIAAYKQQKEVFTDNRKAIRQAYLDFFGKELVIPKPDAEMGQADIENLDKKEKLPTPKKSKLPQTDMEVDTEVAVEAAEMSERVDEEDEEAEERKSPLAMQIVLNPAGQIAAIHSAGRTPSPFSGTMGAHTTAWIVHIDRVRKALIGLKPADAIETVEKVLVPEANKLQVEREKAFKIDENHTNLLAAAKATLESFPAKLKQYDATGQLLGLQQYVDELLTYINYIPGSTLEAADTGGKSEGTHRKVLMAFEQGGKESKALLNEAIFGLLDLNYNLTTPSQQSQLTKQHKEMIKATYPNSYEAVFENKHSDRLISFSVASNQKKRKVGEDE